jgi:MoaA/NifB/PqqE/SkfB family radical SAM enzyme
MDKYIMEIQRTISMNQELDSTEQFNQNITAGYKNVLRFSLQNPSMAWFMFTTLFNYNAASRKRERWATQGVRVPPMLIYSITHTCNLSCKGCYAKALHAPKEGDLDPEKFANLVSQADDIGISIMMLAGGEPFTRPELLDITARHPKIIFPIFTNGLLLRGALFEKVLQQKQAIPIISLEGDEQETDERRGTGVFDQIQTLILRLRQAKHMFGVSITVTRDNFRTVTSPRFIEKLVNLGSQILFFINYVPVDPGTEKLMLDPAQLGSLKSILEGFRHKYPALFVGFPSGEEEFGGCLAAGKGFVHINAEGDVQPCPFSPYADANLKSKSLIEALRSPFLQRVLSNVAEEEESNGICGLWQKREWVESLIKVSPEI